MALDSVKKIEVIFTDVLPAFSKELVLSRLVKKFKTSAMDMQRSNNTFWRPVPYIMPTFNGIDATPYIDKSTQLSVPASINTPVLTTFNLNPEELRDGYQVEELMKASMKALAAKVEAVIAARIASEGTLVVKRTSAPTGFADVAAVDSFMRLNGVESRNRSLVLSPDAYNGMAQNLGDRQNVQGIVEDAYSEAFVNKIAGINLFKTDIGRSLTRSLAFNVTVRGTQYYVPEAMSVSASGQQTPVDNRTMRFDISVGGGTIKAGDCFTIDNCNVVNPITKEDTLTRKTFRVMQLLGPNTGDTTVLISPPIISNGGGSRAEEMYKNVSESAINGAAITMLNTADTMVQPFFYNDAVELQPGTLQIDSDSGLFVGKSSTGDSGIEILLTKQANGITGVTTYVLRTNFGFSVLNPEMAGIELFNQI